MFESQDEQFNQVKRFHARMDGQTQEKPRVFSGQEALYRSAFKLEEIIEYLQASSQDEQAFDALLMELRKAFEQSVDKTRAKGKARLSMVGQADALIDLLYFVYGSFVLMGVDPKPLFDIVHQANMGKIFPDGRAHFDPVTHKILKPDKWEEEFAPEGRIRAELERQQVKDSMEGFRL